jgi:hypothetical protein
MLIRKSSPTRLGSNEHKSGVGGLIYNSQDLHAQRVNFDPCGVRLGLIDFLTVSF